MDNSGCQRHLLLAIVEKLIKFDPVYLRTNSHTSIDKLRRVRKKPVAYQRREAILNEGNWIRLDPHLLATTDGTGL